MYPSLDDEQVMAAVRKSRHGLALSTIFLSYSGREIMIHARNMAETTDDQGLRTYSINLADPTVEHVD